MKRPATGYLRTPNFNQWLYHRRSAYRALFAWVEADRGCWPQRPKTLAALLQHLREHRGDPEAPSETLVRRAFKAYLEDQEHNVRIPRRIARDPLPDSQRRRTKTYSLAPETSARLEKLCRSMGLEAGRVIDALAEEALLRSR